MAEKELKSIKFPGLEGVYVVPEGGGGATGPAGKDGITPTIGANGNWYLGDIDTQKPSRGEKGADGAAGKDGYSPEATVTPINGGAKIIIKDRNGTTSANVMNGAQGPKGDKGDPGATDFSLGITGAQIGQIAKITAVDASGKPTAWEPVEMAGGGGGWTWEKLVDVSLAEAVESVTYTFDNCKRVKALIAPVIASGEPFSGWTRITINNVSYPVFNSRIDTMKGIYIEIDSVYPPYVQASIGTNSNTTTYGFIGGIQTTALENIAPKGITELGCQTAGLLKAGTRIEIWGVKS